MKWYIFNNEENPLMLRDKIVEFDTQEAAENFMIGYIKEENYVKFCEDNGITYRLLEIVDEQNSATINLTNEQIFFIDESEDEESNNAED
jgi:hypothetical protein